MDDNKELKEFWLMVKVRPWFLCPWTGDACPDRVGCVKNDECWRWKQDKFGSLSEPAQK